MVSALTKRCRSCKVVKRGKRLLVICKENPRHKQRQGFKKMSTTVSLVGAPVPHPAAAAPAAAPSALGRPLCAVRVPALF